MWDITRPIINIDTKYLYHNLSCNKKNITFFFFNKKIHLINTFSFRRPNKSKCWDFIYRRVYGYNKKLSFYFLSFIGYNTNVIYTDLDECFFRFFKSFLKIYSDYLSLSWLLLYFKQRSFLLPLLYKGIRFLKKYPSRGQRTKSNFKSIKSSKRIDSRTYFKFKKKLTNYYKRTKYPSWKELKVFYFHKF